jgi:hypothetical protein
MTNLVTAEVAVRPTKADPLHPGLAHLESRMACPNCDTRMEERGCKRKCPKCYYFEDCANL